MSSKNRTRKNSYPNFDLDEYLEERSNDEETSIEFDQDDERSGSFFKNAMLVIAVILSGFLWYFDWSPKTAYDSIFGDSSTEIATTPVVVNIPPITVEIPDVNLETNYRFNFQTEELGTRTDYLQKLEQIGLLNVDLISTFNAGKFYEAGIPISYLEELYYWGYLQRFSFVDIIDFYKNEVPNAFLNELDQAGFLERLSFVDISAYYKNNVSIDYLKKMDQAGYINELSFVQISAYYNNGVTPEFLDELKESGVYNSLSFIDVVEIYKDQN